ncbi:MAG: bifunctional phosphoribosylaminoimidazolecarboxamide formyltransferase/IMP cyclohydrolase [Candidatus Neomarinimicrobiota bacterium]
MLSDPVLNKKIITVRRVLISVFDKTGIVDFARDLHKLGVEILSTGGTAETLVNHNVPVTDISDYTAFPEIMDGRVKTLNPLVAGGILGLRDLHQKDADLHKIKWIDLVICNLYPFSKIIANPNSDRALALENIDIGGPTLIRSAAKNMGWCGTLVNPEDYATVLNELKSQGGLRFEIRKQLSLKAFGHTAKYDSIIHDFLSEKLFPDDFNLTYEKHSSLRYGENPHQQAALYKIPGFKGNNILNAKIHQGKKLSFNNIMDADNALACVREFSRPACVIVKHANPCGVALGSNPEDVYTRAFQADSVSAFGGIVALNRLCTESTARALSKVFIEIVLAPGFTPEALRIFSKKKNLRILEAEEINPPQAGLEIRHVEGGILVQEKNTDTITKKDLQVVTEKQDFDADTMLFGWKVLKYVKSNAILIAREKTTVGIGAGQVSRIDAVQIALKKSGDQLPGSILCSDAFFPFRDSIDILAGTGIKAIIQPGGSIRDEEVITACNEHGLTMVFTGQRCFKH